MYKVLNDVIELYDSLIEGCAKTIKNTYELIGETDSDDRNTLNILNSTVEEFESMLEKYFRLRKLAHDQRSEMSVTNG